MTCDYYIEDNKKLKNNSKQLKTLTFQMFEKYVNKYCLDLL